MKKGKLKKLLWGISIVIILIIFAVGYIFFFPQFHPAKTAYVYIDRDDNVDSVYYKVQKVGNPTLMIGFKWLCEMRDYASHVRIGRYMIKSGESSFRVFNRIYKGYQEPLNLTVGSVRTLDILARSLGKQLMIDSVEIVKVMDDSLFQQKMGYTKETLPCLFIPETYQVYWNMSVDEFFQRMKKEHDNFWNADRLAKAKALGLTPEEVSTIASIVEEETNNNAEKPMVAGLYYNRLRGGMPLQADPTIKYALQDFALRRISNENLRVNSPYNTYRNIGLPPGPIRIPSTISIDAVLNLVKHDYIYMCAKDDFSGTHAFAANYADHMKNAKKYWKALNERKIFK